MKPIIHQSITIILSAVLSLAYNNNRKCPPTELSPVCGVRAPAKGIGRRVSYAPAIAPRPSLTQRTVRVSLIVINRHRQVREWQEPNRLGYMVKRRSFTETWWASWWTWMPIYPPPAGLLVDRGWCAMSDVRSIAPCTEGFSIERKGGMVIIAGELRIIDSPFDWEVKHRGIYEPIR